MEIKVHHWLIALAGAVALHLFLLTFYARSAEPAQVQGILISLGDGADVGEGSTEPESLTPLGTEDLLEAEPVALETIESTAASDIRPEEILPAETDTSKDLIAMTEALPTRDQARRPKTHPKKKKRTRTSRINQKTSKSRRDTRTAKVSAGTATGSGTRKTGTGTARQGTGTGSGAAAAATAQNRYAGQISAWLNRNKRYPKRARRSRKQGAVTVRFTLDRAGRVLSSTITRSSGHSVLDDEVRALMRRGPMPRMPAAMKQARITMTVPIRFRLQ